MNPTRPVAPDSPPTATDLKLLRNLRAGRSITADMMRKLEAAEKRGLVRGDEFGCWHVTGKGATAMEGRR